MAIHVISGGVTGPPAGWWSLLRCGANGLYHPTVEAMLPWLRCVERAHDVAWLQGKLQGKPEEKLCIHFWKRTFGHLGPLDSVGLRWTHGMLPLGPIPWMLHGSLTTFPIDMNLSYFLRSGSHVQHSAWTLLILITWLARYGGGPAFKLEKAWTATCRLPALWWSTSQVLPQWVANSPEEKTVGGIPVD